MASLTRKIIISLIAGSLAGGLVYLFNRPQPPKPQMEAVVMAIRPAEPGHFLTSSDLEVQMVPEGYRHPQASSSITALVGRQVREPIYTGEQVLNSRLVNPGENDLQFILAPGMQAITITVDEAGGVTGLIKPGYRVDLIARQWRLSASGSEVLARNLRVLAVNQIRLPQTAAPAEQGRMTQSVTLEVSPSLAVLIARISSQVQFHLAVHGVGDAQTAAESSSTVIELWRGTQAEQAVVPLPQEKEEIK